MLATKIKNDPGGESNPRVTALIAPIPDHKTTLDLLLRSGKTMLYKCNT